MVAPNEQLLARHNLHAPCVWLANFFSAPLLSFFFDTWTHTVNMAVVAPNAQLLAVHNLHSPCAWLTYIPLHIGSTLVDSEKMSTIYNSMQFN